jgi:Domain of unknown function (DUF4350)
MGMDDFRKLVAQYWKIGLVGLMAIVLLTVVSATGGDIRQSGSSYSKTPDGYGAWYQMMVDRGVKIRRWEKTFLRLTKDTADSKGTTLLRVNSQLEPFQLTEPQRKWIELGNTIVCLGVSAPAQDGTFSGMFPSPQGAVKIETKRRLKSNLPIGGLPKDISEAVILSDRYGSFIVEYAVGKGRLILATTPHLAANTYQDNRPNYELLANLVTVDRQQLIVDEYIHGYRDRSKKNPGNKAGETNDGTDDNSEERTGDILGYLANTPLIIVLLNLTLGMIVVVWQQNQRFGRIIIPKAPQIENSEAYIQALGGVLRQANSSEFVIQNIGRSEQLSWQKKLGLGGERLVDSDILITAWETRTKLPTEDLRFVLKLTTASRRLSPTELTTWLKKLQTISHQLSS